MPASRPGSDPLPQATPRGLGRRALFGVAALVVMTGGVAGLLYNSIEPGLEFASDPDAALRMATLAQVSSWSRLADLEASEGALGSQAQLLLVDASAVAARKLSAAQKSIETLQAGPDGGRRLIMAALTVQSQEFGPGRLDEERLIDDVLTRGIDGVFLECGAALARARRSGRASEEQLILGITELVNRSRLVNPGFLFVLENAAELTVDPRVQRAIDGAAKSDLLFGQDGVGVANNHTDIVAALHDLNRVKKSGRPVFVTEHIAPEEVAVRTGAHQTLSALGFIARFEAGERRS